MQNFSELPKAYDPSSVEDGIYAEWEASGAFNPDTLPDRNQAGEPYCIMMPPPNVTGVLHLGHALENSLMDTMARFQRMRGKKVLIIPGTDHAALPTQAKVEKLLKQTGMMNPRKELGREGLVGKIREFADQSKATILSQVKKMGTSCDWSRLAFTFDDQRGVAVNEMFRRMYEDGLIYRGARVVNWSVEGQSTCSDDEVIHVERPAKLYTFKYSADFPITISSTRPETKLGDTAVAVHPSDERYQQYIGKVYRLEVGASQPLEIKIIADENVDPKFGTGALGVTPAHSPIDFEMYEKQKAKGDPIGLIAVIGSDGCMTEAAGSYQGLTCLLAREKFVTWLKENNLFEKEEDITQSVGTSERFGDVIESIPMTQWWLDMNKIIPGRGKSLKDLMRETVTNGLDNDETQKVTVTPERFTKLYLDRVEHLRDWCLSRQIWWGHRIPVWYKKDEIKVSATSPGEGWVQDEDTLDTWFSSGIWTFSTLGWPEQTIDLKAFHPTSWIQMGYEILYLWMMRMILMSTYALKQIPFHDVYIHGILRDEFGKKFSKSSGNNIDPLDVIKTHGCDALRWSVLIGTTPGNDSRFYEEKIDGARNLVNKLWNISRFILTQTEENFPSSSYEEGNKTLADQWILARVDEVVASVTKKMELYEFSAAGEELREFTWNDVADWYLEIAKIEKGKEAILLSLLKTILTLWHPFTPFVTEHIWKLAGFEGLLIVAPWPTVGAQFIAPSDLARFQDLQEIVNAARRLRTDHKIAWSGMVELRLSGYAVVPEADCRIITALTKASEICFNDTKASDHVFTVSTSKGTVGVFAPGAVDKTEETLKIQKELEETEAYIKILQGKLSNMEFLAKAPTKVKEEMERKYGEAQAKVQTLQQRLETF